MVVVDRGRDDNAVAPYDADQLEAAATAVAAFEDVGVATLEDFEAALVPERRAALYPYSPLHLLLRRELDELFDTTPDLTGAHLDIGRFIRSGEDRDVQVFWLDVPRLEQHSKRPGLPPPRYRARRDELCCVPFLRARDWLCGEESKSQRKPRLRPTMRAWLWDWIDGEWRVATRAAIVPGAIVCVAAECGGYDVARGFQPTSGRVPPVPLPPLPEAIERQLQADEAEEAEDLSIAEWKTLACHVTETAQIAAQLGSAVGLPVRIGEILVLAARWHDLGKVHPAFQGAIRHLKRPRRNDSAKAPDDAWVRPPRTPDGDERPGFRHELASALALFAVLERYQPDHPALLGPWAEAMALTGVKLPVTVALAPLELERAVLSCNADEFDLLAYLVIAHHGKVRVALHASPKDQEYQARDGGGLPIRGVRDGDQLPSVRLEADKPPIAGLSLSLSPAVLGLSPRTGRSWRERTLDLQKRFGPGALAWLEAILIAADRRASRHRTADPALMADASMP